MPSRSGSSTLLAARSLLWVVLMPGIVAGYIPWRFFGFDRSIFDCVDVRLIAGLAVFAGGVALLAVCVWEFARRGRGTTNLFIIGFEEPDLRRRFGPAYDEYRARVGRWIPSRSLKPAENGGETRARRPQ